jgi:hypothetical protein
MKIKSAVVRCNIIEIEDVELFPDVIKYTQNYDP